MVSAVLSGWVKARLALPRPPLTDMANGGVWRKIALFRQSLPGWLITGLAGRYSALLGPPLLLRRRLLPDRVTEQAVEERLAARIAVVSDPVREPYGRAVVARLRSRN